MNQPGSTYLSYLLRLWQVRSGGTLAWRAFLENAHTGERQGFASLDELFAYVRQRTARGVGPPEEGADRPGARPDRGGE